MAGEVWAGGWQITTECPACHHQEDRGYHSAPMFFYVDCAVCGYQGELIAHMRELVTLNGQLVKDVTTIRQPREKEGG